MTTCNHAHPVNALCQDRACYLGDRNPYLRLLRRFDRCQKDLRKLRQYLTKRLTSAGEVTA